MKIRRTYSTTDSQSHQQRDKYMSAKTPKTSSSRFRGLDGLRGLAAMTVVFGHLTVDLIAVTGVYLFFVLSSFLLTSQFLNWSRAEFRSVIHWAYYLQRRFFRIYPLFAFVALISAATTAMHWEQLKSEGFPLSVDSSALIKVLTFRAGPEVLWTIPVEFKFYLILPLIALGIVVLCRRDVRISSALLLLAIGATLILIEPSKNSLSLIPFLSLFLTGCLAAVINRHCSDICRQKPGDQRKTSALAWFMEASAWLALAIWAFTMPIVQQIVFGATILEREPTALMHPLYALIFGTLVVGILQGQGFLRAILEIRAVKWIGTISFSLYLWHIGPIRLMDAIPGLHPHIGGLIAVIISIVVSSISYQYVELPVLKKTSNLLKPQRTASPVSSAPAANTPTQI